MTSGQPLAERPNGSYVEVVAEGHDRRPVVSILVREDDPRKPEDTRQWRAAEGNSNWFDWAQVLAMGHVEPLYSRSELTAAAAAGRVPRPPRQQATTQPTVRRPGGGRR